MRIHSKFKDYYDTALGYGIDKDIHYSRTTTEFKNDDPTFTKVISNFTTPSVPILYNERSLFSEAHNISFCGERYIGINVTIFSPKKPTKYSMCWSIEDLDQVISKYGTKEHKQHWNERKKVERNLYYINRYRQFLHREGMKQIFEINGKEDQSLIDLHHDTGVPIIMYSHSMQTKKIVFNPVLKELKFFRIIEPFQAFQKLSMFISGVLGGQSPKMVDLTNDDLINKHGYDKWSFRKMPEK